MKQQYFEISESYESYDYPRKNRKCTDVICFLFWIIFWIGIIGISIFGFSNGDLNNIAVPFDTDGNACGKDQLSDYNYLYFNNPKTVNYRDELICVKQCPDTNTSDIECYPTKKLPNCNELNVYKSFGFAQRVCLPNATEMADFVKNSINIGISQELVEDVKEAWPVYLIMTFVILVVCIFYFFLLQYCAGVMVVLMCILGVAGMVGFGFFCWKERNILLQQTEYNEKEANFYKNSAIFFWVVAGVFFLLMLCLCSQIKLAIKMISLTSDFISDKFSIVLSPIISILCIVGFFVIWLPAFLYVFSVGNVRHDKGDIFGDMEWTDRHYFFVYAFIFALLWYISFSMSTNIFVIASVTASWYFQRYEDKNIGLCKAYYWAWFFHLGSLAFGSLLIAILWGIQLILNYLYQKAKQTGQDSFLLKAAMCFVACFERLIKFLNQHAYIEIVLRNLNFCSASYKSASLLATNFLRVAILSGLVNLFLVLATFLISTIGTIIGYFILKAYGQYWNESFDTYGPLVIFFLICCVITQLFNSVFDVSADTMLHCYILDEQVSQQQSGLNAQRCPQKLRQLQEEIAHENQLQFWIKFINHYLCQFQTLISTQCNTHT